jgi:radical SAM superfamily enzyme YgiQ (UPF0313 family)
VGYIATALKTAGFEFDILDMDVHKYTPEKVEEVLSSKSFMPKYDVVMFGCIVTGYKIAKEVARIIRKLNKDVFIIAGNSVASSIPELLLKNTEVDLAVIGEGDRAIVDILSKRLFNRKTVYKTFEPIADLDTIPIINWELFDMKKYITQNRNSIPTPYPVGYSNLQAMPVNSARGCLFKCTFCYQVFCNDKYRYRSIEHLGKELDYLKRLYDVNYITFYDDLTIFSKKRAEEFVDLMTGRNIYWTACCRAGLFTRQDKKLLKKLKESNCVSFGYSLESANKEILKAMKKHISLENFAEQKKTLDEAGISTITSLVLAYPQETEETLAETFNFLYDNNVYPSTGYLQPQPATPMYQYALDNGYIKNEEEYLLQMGDRQDLHINMSKIPDDRLQYLTLEYLKRIRDKLKLDLRDDQLIKTGVVRGK